VATLDFCIVSAYLFQPVLDVRVNRVEEMSADHHLVITNILQNQQGLHKRAGLGGPTEVAAVIVIFSLISSWQE